jgi:hypothetical protein
MARPHKTNSKKSPEVVARFLDMIRNGRSCAQACKQDGMPTSKTIGEWVKNDAAFALQYEKAKEERGHYYGELVAEIALAGLQGKYKDSAMLRAAIDGLKWSAGRMAPKAFGDRMEVNHSAEGSYVEALKAVQGKVSGDGTDKLPLALRAREADTPTIQ